MVFLVFTPDSFIIMLQGIVSKENEVDSRGRSTDHHLAHIMTLPIPTQRLNQATMALLLWAAMSSFIFLQAADYQSQTTKDPDISVEFLKLRVIPLEKFELQVETEAWQELLKSKATEIIELEIQEISAEGKEEDQINQRVAEKVRERTLIADRMTIVMNAFQTKGGDLAEYKDYMASVTGIQVDIKEIGKTSSRVVSWLKSEEGGIRWAMNLLWFVVTLIVFRFIALLLGNIARKALERAAGNSSELLKNFFTHAVRKLIFLVGLIVALDFIGIKSGPFLAAFGAAGFILGFALQDTLANLAAGIMILFHRPYDIGNFVTAGGVTGKVTRMNLAATTFLTGDNQQVIVPNGSIWGDVITNVTGSETRRVDMSFGISYDDDTDKAESLILDILKQHPKVLKHPAPTVKTHELGDFSVNLICRPWVKTADYWTVHWDIIKQVKKRFDVEGLSFPYPQHDVHVSQVS
ncbi:MAG: mechanosensitive ion channel [Verrucomicrobia bacterium]|nr:mechanosensitive ion channel [Verrucomicrobiota bacterium]